MGNLLCKFRFPPRPRRRLRLLRSRPPPGDVWPLHPPSRDAVPPPGRDHPAAPSLALGPGRRLFHRNPRPLPASLYVQPKRRYPIPQAAGTPLGIPPLVNWSHSPKKPVLCARNSMMFGHSRAKRIPPLERKFTLPRSLSEKAEEAVEPVPTRHLPLLCPFGVEEKVQEDPRKKMEDLAETKGQNGGNRVPHHVGDIPLKSSALETGGLLTSSQRSPAPLDLHPNPPEDRLRENTQKSLMHCRPEGRAVTSSHGPARNVVPDTDTAALSDPPARCPLLQETSTKEVAGESHQPVRDTSYLSRKEIQANEPPGISSRSSFSPVSASSRPCKRKTSTSHSRPPPPPQWWGHGELPPLPRFPCRTIDKNLDTLKNTKCHRSKTLEDRREIKGDCSDAQSATSLCLLASETANSLLLASRTLQVPIPTDDLADQSAKPPTASVLPSLTPNLGQERAQMVSKSSPAVPAGGVPHLSSSLICGIPVQKEGPLQPVTAVTCLISDITTLPNTSIPSLQPPSCNTESPVPLCVHSPPPILPAPLPNPSTHSSVSIVQPIISKTAASTIAANASTSTSRLTSGPGVVDMDTTPLSKAVIFRSPQGSGMGSPSFPQGRCSLKQRCPAESPVFTSPPGDPKTALLASVAVSSSLSLADSGVTSTPVGKPSATCNSACNSEAMETPSPSQASIFSSSPESRDNHFPLNMVLSGSANTPPRGSTVVAHDSIHLQKKSSNGQTSVSNHSDPGITSQPTTGHHNGQQPNNSHLLGTPVASTQAMGPSALVAQPPRDNAVKAGLAGSASITTLTIQPASSDKPGILPIGVSTTTGFGVATGMPSTGDGGSPLADSTSGRHVFSGRAAPMGSGVYIPGPAHSQASGAFHLGAGLNGVPRTISAPTLGQTTWNRCGDAMAAAVGGTNTVPVFGQNASSTLNPGTWGPPIQNPGSGAVGQGCTVPTGGDSTVPTTHKCPGGSSRQRKLASCRGDATVEKRTKSRDQAASPLNLSSRGPAIKTPGDGVVGEGRPVPSRGISSIAGSLKGTQSQSGQRKLAPRDRATRTEKKRGSGHMPACFLNMIIGGEPSKTQVM
ncbi:nuclear pore-associated protein 1-like [Panthera tigris]|uniref:nuclear pore-associated protein 1-like n=1 Tax=Panthera tigris TaxID=9694 RepID=UPI001C6F731E|nr:nuclear pore-associated protein 1-like [Panthera tigris]